MPPAFARAPALAIEGLLDYTRSEHAKIYKSGIRQVSDVSASFTKPCNSVLYYLSLHQHATVYIWMNCATVDVHGYMRSVHTALAEFTWYPILDSLIGAHSCAPHNF
jgi:hypothetical protein